jgi:hypothetical protein
MDDAPAEASSDASEVAPNRRLTVDEHDRGPHDRVSRRRMIKRLGAATGVAWTAPVLSTVGIPAFAQGSPFIPCPDCVPLGRPARSTVSASPSVEPGIPRATRVFAFAPDRGQAARAGVTPACFATTRPSPHVELSPVLAHAPQDGFARCRAARIPRPRTISCATRPAVGTTPTRVLVVCVPRAAAGPPWANRSKADVVSFHRLS